MLHKYLTFTAKIISIRPYHLKILVRTVNNVPIRTFYHSITGNKDFLERCFQRSFGVGQNIRGRIVPIRNGDYFRLDILFYP